MATGLENLKVYQKAKELELDVFHLIKSFPKDERWRSVDQAQRSSSSVTNNIAESYYKRSIREKVRLLNDIAKCEAEETRKNLEVCYMKRFHNDKEVIEEYTELLKMLSGYIRFLKNLQT